ncbi:sporulation integral membrane protein YtvI [Fredinandcohnia sp. 179-A 10B2 NHS]|uniref:sporulation integral membrane protein YtvI n=1 Tax=Fredinandcohnia sp. 179-A 10B2 NHS TaxID=3235176 RepID=UPI0039A02467
MNINYVYSFLRFLLVVVLLVIGLVLSYFLFKLTYPFIFALLIAFLINPLVNFFENKGRMPRGIAVFIGIILVFAFVTGLLTLLIAEIISGANYLANEVPQHFEKLVIYFENLIVGQIIPFYERLTNVFDNLEQGQQQTIMDNIGNVGSTIATNVGEFIKAFLENIPKFLGWLPNAATVIVFSLLATFFISKDWNKFIGYGRKFIPVKARESGKSVSEELKKALFGFIKAQLTLISITAGIVLVGLLILRVDYAITIALLIGLVDLLPYLGTGLVFVPWIIYSAFSGNLPLAIGLGVLYLVVIVQRQVMEPKIISSSIGLDPLATLISLFVGFQLFGFIGLIIGPVALVIIRTLYTTGVFKDIWGFILGKHA